MEGGGFLADVFHDVDFAALGPADGGNVFAEHPEGGPHALAFRDFDAGFDAAVGLGEEALRFQAGGSVFARDAIGGRVGFFLRGDDEIALFDVGVFGAIGVGLEFVVAPAFAAEVVGPFVGIWRGAVWASRIRRSRPASSWGEFGGGGGIGSRKMTVRQPQRRPPRRERSTRRSDGFARSFDMPRQIRAQTEVCAT